HVEIYQLFHKSRDFNAVLDKKAIFRYCYTSVTAFTGYHTEEILSKNSFEFIHPDDQKVTMKDFSDLVSGKVDGIATEFRFRKADGSWINLEALGNNCINNPAINGVIINARDITLRKRMEDHLLQAHKMQAIGTLAGGIAHDFNNLLMGIQGYISLMLLHKDFDDPDLDKLNNMQSLVQSGADLAANLLGFARGGQYELESTNINELVAKTCSVFGRTKKEIILNQKYEKEIRPVEIDRNQIEQVLINLYINAWQAMSESGGDIYIETDNITLNDSEAVVMDVKEGNYVRIMISDMGRGMDEETCRRVFEPFFTTKEKDRGTGLALASAYGIIKEHGGTIDVMSKLGQGSTFTIYLPASTKEISKETVDSKTLISGNETILLVDDETTIIDVCNEMLSNLGYNILTAGNGHDALELYKKNKDKIDLVILDMIMPGFSGSETFYSLKSINPEVQVMLSTGYIISEQIKTLMSQGCRGFIQKPFRMEELSEKIREVLEQNEIIST
ncbi:MAG: response regulator, partial [Smithella sp.]